MGGRRRVAAAARSQLTRRWVGSVCRSDDYDMRTSAIRYSVALGCLYATSRAMTTSVLRSSIQRLQLDNAVEVAGLISRAFPLSSPHSWARALEIDSDMTGYMTGYLSSEATMANSVCAKNSAGVFIGACILETQPLQLTEEDNKKLQRDQSLLFAGDELPRLRRHRGPP